MQRYEGLKIFKIQKINLAITTLRGPYDPLPYGGAVRLLIVLILFWNLVDWRSKGTKLLLVYHSFTIGIEKLYLEY